MTHHLALMILGFATGQIALVAIAYWLNVRAERQAEREVLPPGPRVIRYVPWQPSERSIRASLEYRQ
jgi:hypothetical protein